MVVTLSPTGVGFVQVKRTGAKPAVTRFGLHELAAPNVRSLRTLGRKFQVDRYRLSTLLNAGEYQVISIEAPNVPEDELKDAVRWRIKDLVNHPVDDVTIDVLKVPGTGSPSSRNRWIYAVVAPNNVIRARMKLFQEAKYDLSVIDVPEMAQRNIAALLEAPGQCLALLSFNESGALLTVTLEGELYFCRRLSIARPQLSQADEAERQLGRLTIELHRSLDHFDRQFAFLSIERLVLAPLQGAPEVAQAIARDVSLPVDALDLGDVFDLSEAAELEEPHQQSRFFLALGAALRQEEPET
ncbi:MAG: agglutinin biogenesis protein MshI [Betaproteobacteria bacterium]|nr:agglutinin biogenesis protein MshI [Betaproteobacteria bacterium]